MTVRKICLLLVATWLLLGAFALGTLGRPATAQAAERVFLVNNVTLEAGKTKNLELGSIGASYKFHALNTLNIECKFMLVLGGSYIVGGNPGVSFVTLEWTSCTGTSKGKSCTEIEVVSPLLRGEVVERTVGGNSTHASTQFSPAEGETLITFKMKCGKQETRVVKGSFQAAPSSQCSNLEEVGHSIVDFPEKVINGKGEEPVESNLEGTGLSISGSSNLKLSDKSTWGVC